MLEALLGNPALLLAAALGNTVINAVCLTLLRIGLKVQHANLARTEALEQRLDSHFDWGERERK